LALTLDEWISIAILGVALTTLAFVIKDFREQSPLRSRLLRKELTRDKLFYVKSILQAWIEEIEIAKIENRHPELTNVRGPHYYVGLAWVNAELLKIYQLYRLTDNDLWNKLTDPPYALIRRMPVGQWRITEDVDTLRGAVATIDKLILSLG
jgi:hypothetical protein